MKALLNSALIGIALCFIGLFAMWLNGCDGYWVDCWVGWDKAGSLIFYSGILVMIIWPILEWIINKKWQI